MFESAAMKLAHNPIMSLMMDDSVVALQELINVEKRVISSLQNFSSDLAKSADSLHMWGKDDSQDDDLADTTSAASQLLVEYSNTLSSFAKNFSQAREAMKSLRSSFENYLSLKNQLRNARDRTESLNRKICKMNMGDKNYNKNVILLNDSREEVKKLDAEVQRVGKEISASKRKDARKVLGLVFGGLVGCCQKGLIIGEAGKLIASEIVEPQNGYPRPPYNAQRRTKSLVTQAKNAISGVVLDISLVSTSSESPSPYLTPPSSSASDEFFSALGHGAYHPNRSSSMSTLSRSAEQGSQPPSYPIDSSHLNSPSPRDIHSTNPWAAQADEFGYIRSAQDPDERRDPRHFRYATHSDHSSSAQEYRDEVLGHHPDRSSMSLPLPPRRPLSIIDQDIGTSLSLPLFDPSLPTPPNSPPGLSTSPPNLPASAPRLRSSPSRASLRSNASFSTAAEEPTGGSHNGHSTNFPSLNSPLPDGNAGIVDAALDRFNERGRYDSAASGVSAIGTGGRLARQPAGTSDRRSTINLNY